MIVIELLVNESNSISNSNSKSNTKTNSNSNSNDGDDDDDDDSFYYCDSWEHYSWKPQPIMVVMTIMIFTN